MDARHWNLWAYLPNGAAGGAAVVNYGPLIEALSFSTLAPGGFGDLKATIKVADARILPDELRPFSRVALTDRDEVCFLGRWDEPGSQINVQGDVLMLSALGAAACLSDDPQDASAIGSTPQAIIAAEMSKRGAYLALDTDTSQILPDNPAITFSDAWPGQSMDQLLNTLSTGLGDYVWAVWEHPTHRDQSGFATWQLFWHVRDTTTIGYSVFFDDVDDVQVNPSLEYTYNVVTVLYHDTAANAPASVTVRDSRLNADLSQGSAPFPMRRLRKDLSNLNLSSAQATALANALLADYQNGGFKITVKVSRLRDANGGEIPLTTARADRNLSLPEFAQYGISLPFTPATGTNVWYIQETQYDEPQSGSPTLTLSLDAFPDRAAFQLARLQYSAQLAAQSAKVANQVKQPGKPESGNCGLAWGSTALGGDVYEVGVNFKTEMSNTPTSITLTPISSTNASASITNITKQGFTLRVAAVANGAGAYRATYTTVGN